MNRNALFLVLLFSLFAFATTGGAGGMERFGEQTMQATGAVVLIEGAQDRCQMAASCSATCVLCAAGLLTETAKTAEDTAGKADLHCSLARRTVSKRLYRPPKSGGTTCI